MFHNNETYAARGLYRDLIMLILSKKGYSCFQKSRNLYTRIKSRKKLLIA